MKLSERQTIFLDNKYLKFLDTDPFSSGLLCETLKLIYALVRR